LIFFCLFRSRAPEKGKSKNQTLLTTLSMEKEKLTTKKKRAIFFAPHILRLSGLFFLRVSY